MEFGCLPAEQLLDYFDHKWLPSQMAAIERHLAGCDKCAALARQVFEADGAIEFLLSFQARKAVSPASKPQN